MNASQTASKTGLEESGGERLAARPAKLLIVDDEPDICEFLAEELSDQGYECLTTGSVDDAIAIARKFQPQVIISDVRMPYKTGIDLLQVVSSFENPIPVILISGFTDVSLQQIYRLGAAALFAKPLNIELLLAQIQSILSISRIPFGGRLSNRTPTDFPAQVSLKLSGEVEKTSSQATVCNISRMGIYVQLEPDVLPAVGQKISFAFHDPKTELGIVRGTAICRWMHQVSTHDSAKEPTGGFGAEFDKIERDCFEALLHYVSLAGSFWSPGALVAKPVTI